MKGTVVQIEQPSAHVSSETLDAISAKSMSTRQDMLWNPAHAAEACHVAFQARSPAQSGVKFRHYFAMQVYDVGRFVSVHEGILVKLLVQ